MAEGFSSIADLKIVVDASTEKLQSNLASASGLIQRFAGDGNKTLSGFDALLAKAGAGAGALRDKFGVLATALQLVGSNMQAARAVGEQFAAKMGASEDFNKVTESLSDMAAAIEEGLGAAWERATGKAAGFFAVAGATDGAAPGVGFSKAAADAAVDGIGQISHAFRRLAEDGKQSTATLDNEIGLVKHKIEEMSAAATSVAREGSLVGDLFNVDYVKLYGIEVDKLTERLAQLQAAKEARAAADASAERAKVETLGNAEYEKLIPIIEKEITALERKAAALGLTKGEAASYAAVMQVIDGLTKGGAILTEDAALKLGDYAARVRELTDAAEAFSKVEQAKKFVDGLEKEVRNLDQQAAALGKTTAEIAANNVEMRIRNQIEDQGLQLSAEQRAHVDETISAIKERTAAYQSDKAARDDAERDDRAFEQSILKLQRETMLLREKAALLRDGSEGGQVDRRYSREAGDLEGRGVPVTGDRATMLRAAITDSIREKRIADEFDAQMKRVLETGNVVARGLESAFAKFADGGKISVRDMVQSMLSDIAQLTFKRGVIETLFGGGGGAGGASSGGLLGSVFGSLFGPVAGARANGGPVLSGSSYLVGEQGPELFAPGLSGMIIPNHALGAIGGRDGGAGGGSVTVNMPISINAAGAYPESIADIRREVASLQSDLPGRVVQVVREAQDRGVA